MFSEAAFFGRLNTCAAGVTVVNIDNGFGAGYFASLVNRESQVVTPKKNAVLSPSLRRRPESRNVGCAARTNPSYSLDSGGTVLVV